MTLSTKKQHNAFTTHEVEILRKRWPTMMPMEELLALLPRHTRNSLTGYANKVLKLRRPTSRATPGSRRPKPAWDKLHALLKGNPMTQQEIATAMGFSRSRASEILAAQVGEVYISFWRPHEDGRHYEAVWSLGHLPNARMPTYIKRYVGEIRRTDPFASLIRQVAA